VARLAPIPLGTRIVDQNGGITLFFRQLWQQLIDLFGKTSNLAQLARRGQTAALAAIAIATTETAALYRVSFWIHKTVADGVSSSLTVTLGWTSNGVPLTQTFAALALDSTTAQQSGSVVVQADAFSDVTIAIAYASGTPGHMTYEAYAVVEQFG
jgi:hypothetical protein